MNVGKMREYGSEVQAPLAGACWLNAVTPLTMFLLAVESRVYAFEVELN